MKTYKTTLTDNMIHSFHNDPIPVTIERCEEGKIHIYLFDAPTPQIVLTQLADWVDVKLDPAQNPIRLKK